MDLALYPMVEESEATGVVAAVYADLLTRMRFVPSLFKTFALCPQYLVLANEQARDGDALQHAARELVASVQDVVQPPRDEGVRATLGRYAEPISRMLLLSAGLQLALRSELTAPSARGEAPPSRPLDPDLAPPSQRSAPAPGVYGEIRAALGTPIVNTVWRDLADAGQLDVAWDVLRPQVPAALAAAEPLQARAVSLARQVRWPAAADPVALRRAGAPDAAAGMATVLDAYGKTLARVLALAASSA